MSKVQLNRLAEFVNEEVTVDGWIYNFRSSGKISFLQLRDGFGVCQCVADEATLAPEVWAEISRVTLESSVSLTGLVTKHPKKDEYEIQVKGFRYYQLAPADYPIGKKEHGPDFLLENRHLWLRAPRQAAIQRVRTTVIMATYEYFLNNGFTKIDSPILTPNACEGTTELFEMDYFDEGKAYLSQSGQLYLEAAIAGLGRVFDFGPVFRAEKSKTRRHLTEFWMMDAEMAFCDQTQNMDIQEGLMRHIIRTVLAKNAADLATLERDVEKLRAADAPFKRLTYAETLVELKKKGSDINDGEDLGNDDETLLMQGEAVPIFVTNWPAAIKAFYMKRADGLALCADLIAPEGHGEIIGGSQREDDYDELLKRVRENNLSLNAFRWYLDTRKYGSVPHAGFGYGLERVVGWMCGVEHIRETIPFPRMINCLYP